MEFLFPEVAVEVIVESNEDTKDVGELKGKVGVFEEAVMKLSSCLQIERLNLVG